MLDINLLRKQQKQTASPFVYAIVVCGLLVLFAGIITWQVVSHQNELASLKQQQEQNLTMIQQMNNGTNDSSIPTDLHVVKMMDELLAVIPENAELIQYTFSAEQTLQVTLLINDLSETADYITSVTATGYTNSASLLSYSEQGATTYQAVFDIVIDQSAWLSEVAE